MRIIQLLLLFLIIGNYLVAQNTIRSFETSLNVNYSLHSNQFALSTKENSIKQLSQAERLSIKNVYTKDGNMVVAFKIPPFPKQEKKMYLQLELSVYDTLTKYERFAFPQNLGGITRIAFNSTTQEKEIIWEDWIENVKPTNGFLELKLIGRLISPQAIHCQQPLWKQKQKMPHIIGSGIGLTLFLTSIPIRLQSKNMEEQYINQFLNLNQPANQNLTEAIITESYSNANTQHRTANFLEKVGLSLLATSLVSSATRFIIYKRRKKQYDYYCNPALAKLSVKPTIQWDGQIDDQIGVQLTYSF